MIRRLRPCFSAALTSALLVLWVSAGLAANSEWVSRGIGGGGALFSVSMSPHDINEIYMSTDMSSVFHTKDYGQSWETLDFRRLQGGHDSHVRFTADKNILYAIHVKDDLDYGTPVRSDDGGITWYALASDPTGGEVWWLHADPNSSSALLLASYSSLYFSSDGGGSFNRVYSASDLLIAGAFWGSEGIFVGTQEGLLVSSDGGASFPKHTSSGLPAGAFIVGFAGAESAGTCRLIAIISTDAWPGITAEDLLWGYNGVYRLDWGNDSWQAISSGIAATDGLYFTGMAPGDINTVYLAGGNRDDSLPVVYRSNDGGTNWSGVFLTRDNANIITGWCGDGGDLAWWWPEYAMGFAVSPVNSLRAVITDFGFVHVTDDGGQSWRQAYVKPRDQNPAGSQTPKGKSYEGVGLEQTSVWWLNWSDAHTLTAAFTDIRGLRSTDGGRTWQAGINLGLPHNSTYQIIAQPGSGTLYGATSTVHDLYQSTYLSDERIDTGEGHLIVSVDNGASWQTLHDFGHPVVWLAFDPNHVNTLYASIVHSKQGGVYVTYDIQNGSSATWQKLAAPPRTQGHPFNTHILNDGSLVATYSGRRDSSGVFTASSGLFISSDGGLSWNDRSHEHMQWWTKDLVVNPHDPSQSTWLVAVFRHWGGGHEGVGGLYRTTDRGQSWTRISDIPRVESVAIDPQNRDVAYLTTETEGLWRSQNFSSTEPVFTQDTDYPFRHPLRIFFNPYDQKQIWVTSFGGGLRTREIGSSVQLAIQANGSDGPVTVTSFTPLSIDIRLNPGARRGELADWWIAVNTPFAAPGGWFTYVYPTGWLHGIHLCIQAGLFELAPSEVLNTALPAGHYTFYFAIDDPDGEAFGPWWGIDSVEVTVQ